MMIDVPQWLVDIMRVLHIMLAVISAGVIAKLIKMRAMTPRRRTTDRNWWLTCAALLFVVYPGIEHILRIGEPLTWRLPFHISIYLMGLIGLFRSYHIKNPWGREREEQ